MITVDWGAVLWGLVVGAPVSTLFFVGLAWGIRRAIASAHAGVVLSLSALARIGLLLLVGYAIMRLSGSVWSLAGYMLAFLVIRLIAVGRVRVNPPGTAGDKGDVCN
ncbi:MAG: ATP synthase subunit I [Marinobacter sp.]|nr:ATP synthase subunit I [Marinobacter sp.]